MSSKDAYQAGTGRSKCWAACLPMPSPPTSCAPPHPSRPQIVCDPAKLVLTKSPGSCVHKYKSASSWVGKECKHSGGIGFSDEMTIGGGEKTIPLIDIDIGYSP